MPAFTFSAVVTVSAYTEVEADTYEEALEIAQARGMAGLCAQPFAAGIGECWHTELDGEVQNIVGD